MMHSFFFPTAFQTIATILQSNEELLLQLLENKETVEESPIKLSKKPQSSSHFEENIQAKQTSIEHISSTSKEQLKMIETLRLDFADKQKKAFFVFIEFYDKVLSITKDLQKRNLPYNQDPINFYIGNCMNAIFTRISQPKRLNLIKKNLFSFLNLVCLIGQAGVNSNQEMIFKIMIQEFKTLDYVLIHLETDENKLVLNIENNKRELEEIFSYNEKSKNIIKNVINSKKDISLKKKNSTIFTKKEKEKSPNKESKGSVFFKSFKQENGKNKENELLLKEEISASPHSREIEMVAVKNSSRKSIKQDVLKHIQKNVVAQLDFYCHMCNGRNYTWKTHLEKSISYNSLIRYLDSQLDFSNQKFFFFFLII